jgi:GrpB-like predicted nucleotidyltransferase (UPF0157 family)
MRDLLVPYDARWALAFQQLRHVLQECLHDVELDVQHVGSTAIPGMPAKPILDIDIIIDQPSLLPVLETRLKSMGYTARGDQGIPGRYAFRQPDASVPRSPSRREWMTHHVYVCLADSLALKNHIHFRDALLADRALAEAYGRLKMMLAQKPGMDRDRYTRAKTEFVLQVLSVQGFSEAELQQIGDANR